jgi:hypothetical protein
VNDSRVLNKPSLHQYAQYGIFLAWIEAYKGFILTSQSICQSFLVKQYKAYTLNGENEFGMDVLFFFTQHNLTTK